MEFLFVGYKETAAELKVLRQFCVFSAGDYDLKISMNRHHYNHSHNRKIPFLLQPVLVPEGIRYAL